MNTANLTQEEIEALPAEDPRRRFRRLLGLTPAAAAPVLPTIGPIPTADEVEIRSRLRRGRSALRIDPGGTGLVIP